MQELGLMERFADPALFEGLSFGEKLSGSLITTLMGMGTTFVILALLWFIIAMTSKLIMSSEKKAAAKEAAKEAASVVAPAPAPVQATAAVQAADTVTAAGGDELVAVLMAAIAASEGTEFVNKLRISKISRIAGSRPAWNIAGSNECLDSRRI